MLLVGLTGGIGAGKSTVADLLAERGAVVLDADEFARLAVAPGTAGLRLVEARFGPDVLADDGSLDREALARAVFADPAARRELEAIVHPEVQQMFLAAVEPYRATDRVVIYVVPLLVERDLRSMFDLVVTLSADEETRIARLTEDRAMDRSAALARLGAQATDDDRERVADVVIRNDGSLTNLERSVDALWSTLSTRAAAGAANDFTP